MVRLLSVHSPRLLGVNETAVPFDGVKCFWICVSQTRTSAFAWQSGDRPQPFLFSGGYLCRNKHPPQTVLLTEQMRRSAITPEALGEFKPMIPCADFVSLLGISIPELYLHPIWIAFFFPLISVFFCSCWQQKTWSTMFMSIFVGRV